MTLSLPLPLLRQILVQASKQSPSEPASNTSASRWRAWCDALQIWRGVLTEAQRTPDTLGELLEEAPLWSAAVQCIARSTATFHFEERTGDWAGRPPTPELEAELKAWQTAGLLPAEDPASTTEWPAVALVHLATRHHRPLEKSVWQERICEALWRNSPTLASALLEHRRDGSVDEALALEHTPPHESPRPHAYLLFSAAHAETSAVFRSRVTSALARTHDAEGRTPLFRVGSDLAMAQAWLSLGADPNARDGAGRFPETVVQLNNGLSSATALHALLGHFRSNSDQAAARAQWRATAALNTSLGLLRENGLLNELQAFPYSEAGPERTGLLRHLLLNSDFSTQGKERLTLVVQLLKGRKGLDLLRAEGSLVQGVAVALALATKSRDEDWQDRRSAFEDVLGPALTEVSATADGRQDLVQRTLELLPLLTHNIRKVRGLPWVGPEALQRLFGDARGQLRTVAKPTEGEALPPLEVTALRPLGAALGHAASGWTPLPRDEREARPWRTTCAVVTQLLAGAELSAEDREAWLPLVLFLGAVFPEADSLRKQAVAWRQTGAAIVVDGVPSNGGSRFEQMIAQRWPEFEAMVRQGHMEARLTDAAPPARRARRL